MGQPGILAAILTEILPSIRRLCWPDNRCLLCGAKLQGCADGICRACRSRLDAYACCPCCGGFIRQGEPRHPCAGLPDKLPGGVLLGMLAAAPYTGHLRQKLLELKYRRQPQLAEPMAELLAWAWKKAEQEGLLDFTPDLVVPVPLHQARQQQRGYNQSELLAKAFARRLGLPVAEALARLRDTEAQHRLTARERAQNVAGAFGVAVAPDMLAGRRVLLLDDIITSGATIRSCAEALERAGCKEVYAAAVAGHLYK